MKKTLFGLLLVLAAVGLQAAADESNEPKKLAPGVMKTIRPFINYSETYQWGSVPAIMAKDYSYEWAENLYFNKNIWCLEFSFKPIRTMTVDFPTESGTMDRKTVLYLVYSVTNTGQQLTSTVSNEADDHVSIPARDENGKMVVEQVNITSNNLDGVYEPKLVDLIDSKPDEKGTTPGTVRFVPRFVLVGNGIKSPYNYKPDPELGGQYVSEAAIPESKVYNDQFLPLALIQIAAFEDPNQKFENSVTFPALDLPPGKTAWGIAAWTDVDPRIDRFTLYVSGLTNALRWENNSDAYKPDAAPMEGQDIFRKTLKINFFRPGDAYEEADDQFYYGNPGELKFDWVFL